MHGGGKWRNALRFSALRLLRWDNMESKMESGPKAESQVKRYFETRAARANPEEFERILAKAGTLPPREGDEIPEGSDSEFLETLG